MEQNFQTSFIPKKPMVEERVQTARSVGLFSVVSMFLLFAILIASGGLYFYKGVMAKDIVKMESELNLAKNRLEASRITQLQVLDKRLRAGREILGNHVSITPIFKALEAITMKTVRFTKFGYEFTDEKTPRVLVKMSGVAVGYRSVALQSDLFAKNKYLVDPVFSNLSLDNSGNVLFDLDFTVDPVFVDYQNTLLQESTATDVPEITN